MRRLLIFFMNMVLSWIIGGESNLIIYLVWSHTALTAHHVWLWPPQPRYYITSHPNPIYNTASVGLNGSDPGPTTWIDGPGRVHSALSRPKARRWSYSYFLQQHRTNTSHFALLRSVSLIKPKCHSLPPYFISVADWRSKSR